MSEEMMPNAGIDQQQQLPTPQILIPGDGINSAMANDYNRLQMQPVAYSASQSQVKLTFFSPQLVPIQVVHPYQYQFTSELIDEMSSNPLGPAAAVQSNSPAVRKAILPSNGGLVLDTRNLSNQWTFVLIIDTGMEMHGTVTTPGLRQIALGYVLNEEPIDALGNPNPNAILVFTNNTIKSIRRQVGNCGSFDGLKVYANQETDYTGYGQAQLYDDAAFVSTPQDIMRYHQSIKSNPLVPQDFSDMALKNAERRKCPTVVLDCNQKAPINALSDIASAIDSTTQDVSMAQAGQVSNRFTGPNGFSDQYEDIINKTTMQLPGSVGILYEGSLDTTVPKSLGEIISKYSESLYIDQKRITRVDGNYGWDRATQVNFRQDGSMGAILSPRLQMSYLATSVIQSVFAAFGVSDASFSYRVTKGGPYTGGRQVAFQFNSFQTVVPRSAQDTVAISGCVKKALDDQLFSVIEAVAEEFQLLAFGNMCGDILVNLKLFQFDDPEDGTFFQTSSRLGGMVNPAIGTINDVTHNVQQLINATDALLGSGISQANFEQNYDLMPSATKTF